MSRNTARFLLPYPEGTDSPDVPRDMRALAEAVDTALNGRAASGHTHALPDHRHDATYAAIVHSHPLPVHKHDYMVGQKITASFDNNGSLRWTHGLGRTPASVVVTQASGGSMILLRVGNIDSTLAVITGHVPVVGDKGNALTLNPYKSTLTLFCMAWASPVPGSPGNN
jgi:hypothetical protein